MPDKVAFLKQRLAYWQNRSYQTPYIPANCSSPGLQQVVKSGYWQPYTTAHAPDDDCSGAAIEGGNGGWQGGWWRDREGRPASHAK